MSKQLKNYSEDNKNKRKIIFIILIFITAILLALGIVAAFYSDIVSHDGFVTTGTLKISASYTFFLNGKEVQLEDVKNLNPGDVIVIKGTVTNNGNKSAWIRNVVSLDSTDNLLLPYLKVYTGEHSQADLLMEQDLPSLDLSASGIAATGSTVLDGSGESAEIEEAENEDFTYLHSSSYDIEFTIYFLPSADNETQGHTFGITVGAQALQFRNNNSDKPSETAWSAVISKK